MPGVFRDCSGREGIVPWGNVVQGVEFYKRLRKIRKISAFRKKQPQRGGAIIARGGAAEGSATPGFGNQNLPSPNGAARTFHGGNRPRRCIPVHNVCATVISHTPSEQSQKSPGVFQ